MIWFNFTSVLNPQSNEIEKLEWKKRWMPHLFLIKQAFKSALWIRYALNGDSIEIIGIRIKSNLHIMFVFRPGSRNSGHHMGFRRQSVSSAESRKQDSSSESRKDEFVLMPPPAKIPSVRRRPAAQTSPNQVFR